MQARASYSHYWWTRAHWRNHKGDKLDFVQHRYLEAIYEDFSQNITITKAAQLGLSEYALSKAFFVADKKAGNVGYFFPASGQVYDHVQMRVDPVIESSEYIKKLTARSGLNDREKAADKMSLKRVGKAFVMFRGAQNPRQVTSTPLDFAILDEYDRFEGVSISMIEKRLNHSKLKWILNISTPTFPGRGIDLEIQSTDQMEWYVRCKHCNKQQTLSYWNNVDEERFLIVCAGCRKQMTANDIQQGQWIARYPKNQKRGYIMSGLLNPYIDIKKLVDRIHSHNEFTVQEAYNQDLGLPYSSSSLNMTDAQMDACQGDYAIPWVKKKDDRVYAGCDVGRISYFTAWIDDISGKPKLIGAHELHDLETDLPYYMKLYDVRSCVIDGLPETNLVTKLVEKFSGRLFAAHYDYHTINDGSYTKWYDGAVTIHRTASLDEVYGRLKSGQILLPKHAKYIPGLYDHFKNQTRALQLISKKEMYVYVDNGKPDHYAHSANYALVAREQMPAVFAVSKKESIITTEKSAQHPNLSNIAAISSVFNKRL